MAEPSATDESGGAAAGSVPLAMRSASSSARRKVTASATIRVAPSTFAAGTWGSMSQWKTAARRRSGHLHTSHARSTPRSAGGSATPTPGHSHSGWVSGKTPLPENVDETTHVHSSASSRASGAAPSAPRPRWRRGCLAPHSVRAMLWHSLRSCGEISITDGGGGAGEGISDATNGSSGRRSTATGPGAPARARLAAGRIALPKPLPPSPSVASSRDALHSGFAHVSATGTAPAALPRGESTRTSAGEPSIRLSPTPERPAGGAPPSTSSAPRRPSCRARREKPSEMKPADCSSVAMRTWRGRASLRASAACRAAAARIASIVAWTSTEAGEPTSRPIPALTSCFSSAVAMGARSGSAGGGGSRSGDLRYHSITTHDAAAAARAAAAAARVACALSRIGTNGKPRLVANASRSSLGAKWNGGRGVVSSTLVGTMMSSGSPSLAAVVSSGPVISSVCASAKTTTGGGGASAPVARACTSAAPIAVGTANPTAASCGGSSRRCVRARGAARPEHSPASLTTGAPCGTT
eukprot:4595550-Prymnesium_polylepis.1